MKEPINSDMMNNPTPGTLIAAFIGEDHPLVSSHLPDMAAKLKAYGKLMIENTNDLYTSSKKSYNAMADAQGEDTTGGSATFAAAAFLLNPASKMMFVIVKFTWLVLLLAFVGKIIKAAVEFSFLIAVALGAVTTADPTPLKSLTIRFVATRFWDVGFILAGIIGYFLGALAATSGYVDSMLALLLSLWIQILCVGVFTFMSSGLIVYAPSSIPMSMGAAREGGGGGGGGGGGDSPTKRQVEMASNPAAIAGAAVGGTVMASKMQGGVMGAVQGLGEGISAKMGGGASAALGEGGKNRRKETKGGDGGGEEGGDGGGEGGGEKAAKGSGDSGSSPASKRGIAKVSSGNKGIFGSMMEGAQTGFKNPGVMNQNIANGIANSVSGLGAGKTGAMAAIGRMGAGALTGITDGISGANNSMHDMGEGKGPAANIGNFDNHIKEQNKTDKTAKAKKDDVAPATKTADKEKKDGESL